MPAMILPSPSISPVQGGFNFDQPSSQLDPYGYAVSLPQIPVHSMGIDSTSSGQGLLGSPVSLGQGFDGTSLSMHDQDLSPLPLLPQQERYVDDGTRWLVHQPPEGAKWNKVPDVFNLYTTRFVKGNAGEKCGLCPICIEPVERGGSGEEKWLKVRFSGLIGITCEY